MHSLWIIMLEKPYLLEKAFQYICLVWHVRSALTICSVCSLPCEILVLMPLHCLFYDDDDGLKWVAMRRNQSSGANIYVCASVFCIQSNAHRNARFNNFNCVSSVKIGWILWSHSDGACISMHPMATAAYNQETS